MATTKQIQLYANLMEEVKVRLICIGAALRGNTGYPAPIVREFGYLQLRLTCEVIALGCLAAHGDIAALKAHHKAHSADDILDRLTKLRPHFYPIACKQTMQSRPDGRRNFIMDVKNPHPLPKDVLLALYGTCHQHVHRGNLKNLMSSVTAADKPPNLPEIANWAHKINDLLSVHTIAISENEGIICILRNKDDKGKVQVATFAREKPSQTKDRPA